MSDKKKGPNTSQWSVEKYLEESYVPHREGVAGVTENSVKWYRYVVRALNRYADRKVKLREVDDELLEDFKAWLKKQGYTATTIKRFQEILRAICRHWRPELFPIECVGRVDSKWLYSDQEGTLEHLFFDRYLPTRPSISSQLTINQYGRSIRRFNEFLGRPAQIGDLSDETVGGHLRWLIDTKGVKAVTANGEVKQIKSLWNWAAKKRLVEHFPTLGKLPEPERVPQAWTEEELAKLFAALSKQDGKIGKVDASKWWIAFHLLLWDSGERTGAMLAMRWEWLDRKKGVLIVPGEFRKGRIQAMVYTLKAETLAALNDIAEPTRELMFPRTDSHKSDFYGAYKRLILSAGLEYVPHRTGPQKMRRTFASFLEQRGGNATKALRHCMRKVTEDSYLDPRITITEPENLKLPALGSFGGNSEK